jgi:MFS family permease
VADRAGDNDPSDPAEFDLRALAVSVFLPTSMMAIGQGATAPVIALVAIDLGASVAVAGLVVGLFGFGAFAGSVPGGLLAARLGDRGLMALSTSLMGVASLLAFLRPSLVVFGLLVSIIGAMTSMFGVGRLAHTTELSPIDRRGRVMSTVGGTNRVGLFIGPILGALVIGPLGVTGPFLIHSTAAFLAALSILGWREPTRVEAPTEARPSLLGIVREHRTTFATAGMAVVMLQILRGSRQAIIPLWGNDLGLDARQIGILFSLSAGVEILMFYPVGRRMDRRGRKSTAIPSLLFLSLGMAAIPLTSDFVTLGFAVALIGFANGMGAGINQTLSADLSPTSGRSVFLGLWRMLTDAGTAGGPSVVALTVSLASLSAAPVVLAGIGLGGALLMWRMVPETLETGRTAA